MMRRIAVWTLLGALALLLVVAASTAPSSAQEGAQATPAATRTPAPPTPTPTAYPFSALGFALVARADLQVDPDGPVVISAATLAVPVGASSYQFISQGETVVVVQAGRVALDADADLTVVTDDLSTLIGLPPVAASPTGDADEVSLTARQHVVLPPGATARLRNEGDVPATVLVLSVVPAAEGTPQPTPEPET